MGGSRKKRSHGFTVIELIIVITVIGILASIVLAVYPGYQQRARDTQRKNDVQQIATALSAYAQQNDTNGYMEVASGCGFLGNGSGWTGASGGWFSNSIISCLVSAKVLSGGTFTDPSGCLSDSGGACGSNPAQAYMKMTCKKGGSNVTYVMAHLETQPRKDSEVDGLCDVGGATDDGFDTNGQKWGTNYGMNYYVVAK